MADYNKFAKTYYEKRQDKTRLDYNRDLELPAIINVIGPVKGKTLLDMGCGFGDHAEKLSKKGAKKIIGFDLSSKLIKIAQERNIPRCEFTIGDMSKKLPYKKNTFDIVYSSLAVHYIGDLHKLFKEVKRVLKPGGSFIFSTGHPVFNVLCNEKKDNTTKKGYLNKKKIDYFNEKRRSFNFGSKIGMVKLYPYTLETFIQTLLKTGFTITDYKECQPAPRLKKIDPRRYDITTRIPSFIIFKGQVSK